MTGFGFYLMFAILCGPGLVPMWVGMVLAQQCGWLESSRGTSGGIGLLILGAAFLTAPLTGIGVSMLARYGQSGLAAAWGISYLTAWTVYASMIFWPRR